MSFPKIQVLRVDDKLLRYLQELYGYHDLIELLLILWVKSWYYPSPSNVPKTKRMSFLFTAEYQEYSKLHNFTLCTCPSSFQGIHKLWKVWTNLTGCHPVCVSMFACYKKKIKKTRKISISRMKFASVSEDHPIMNLWKMGSDKCCSFHFLVHHSEWPILRFKLLRKSQNHAMNSMLRTQGLGIECETYQQKCNYHACCQLPDWRTLDVTSCVLLIHSKPRRDKKEARWLVQYSASYP